MRISDWSSDVCSSDLAWSPHQPVDPLRRRQSQHRDAGAGARATRARRRKRTPRLRGGRPDAGRSGAGAAGGGLPGMTSASTWFQRYLLPGFVFQAAVIAGGYATGRELVEFFLPAGPWGRSEEHTSELQSLMRISYAVFCL